MLDIKSSMSTGIIIHLPVNEDNLNKLHFLCLRLARLPVSQCTMKSSLTPIDRC
jgi:hypothetical protein